MVMELLILEWLLRGLEAFSLTKHLTRWLRPRLRYRLTLLSDKLMRGHIEHYPAPCDDARLEQLLALGNHFYERSTGAAAESIRDFHKHNPAIVTAIIAFDRKTSIKAVAGYYVLLPLKKRAIEAVQSGRIEGSRHFRNDDICRTFQRFAALYVSAVFGVDRMARIATTNWLLNQILYEKDKRSTLKLVFARPATPDGAAIFESLTGRKPVLGDIQIIDLDDGDIRKRYMERGIRVRRIGRKRHDRRSEVVRTPNPV
jgi:hypothetical protein